MKLISSIEVFEKLLTTFNKKGAMSNFYMLNNEYSKHLESNDFYFYKDAQNLYIYHYRQEYFKLFYFINDLSRFYFNPDVSLPQVLEIVYRGKKHYPSKQINFWKSSGFESHLCRDNYYLKNTQVSLNTITDVRVVCAKSNQEILYAKKLIEDNLDRYTADQLSLSQVKQFAKNNLLYIAYHGDKPCGMLQAHVKNNVFWLGHIVVHSSFRGRGVAKALVEYYLKSGKKLNCNQFQLWVIKDNIAAVNLYKKYGYRYLNKSTYSMLKK